MKKEEREKRRERKKKREKKEEREREKKKYQNSRVCFCARPKKRAREQERAKLTTTTTSASFRGTFYSFKREAQFRRKGGREDFLRDLYITQKTHADADADARRFAQNHHTFHRNKSLSRGGVLDDDERWTERGEIFAWREREILKN